LPVAYGVSFSFKMYGKKTVPNRLHKESAMGETRDMAVDEK